MKVIFVQRDCLLRAGGCDPEQPSGDIELTDETVSAIRALAATALPIILVGRDALPASEDAEGKSLGSTMRVVARHVSEAADGVQLDALLVCNHTPETECGCWGPHPGYLYEADVLLEARLNESYFLGDSLLDVNMAYAGGCRPVLVLAGRSIGEIFGDRPEHKDVPVAIDLQTAARYIQQEEKTTEETGKPWMAVPPALDTEYFESGVALPEVIPLSTIAQTWQAHRGRSRLTPSEVRRMMLAIVAGGVVLSLGIAYILTHLYRQQHFPEWVWYVTLQFIPRQVRGLIFILFGLLLLGVALWSIYRGMTNNRLPKSKGTPG